MKILKTLAVAGASMAIAAAAHAETRVVYKSAKSTSSYYQMAVQIAEAMKAGSNGDIIVTVEESQGSVQNVMEAAVRPGNYVFTTPPALVGAAVKAAGPFKDKGNPKFAEIRALFPIPSLTMHFVMSEKSGAKSFADLEGKTVLIGDPGRFYLPKMGLKRIAAYHAPTTSIMEDSDLRNAQVWTVD